MAMAVVIVLVGNGFVLCCWIGQKNGKKTHEKLENGRESEYPDFELNCEMNGMSF